MREKIVTAELKNKLPGVMASPNYQKILQFYLLESPVEENSYRGVLLADKGWRSQNLRKLNKYMLEAATPELEKNYHPCKKEELEKYLKEYQNATEEHCVFLNDKGATTSVYNAIRNAFAHGSFDVRQYGKETVYFFANYHTYYKAKIILKEQTLLKWIEIFNNGCWSPVKKGGRK